MRYVSVLVHLDLADDDDATTDAELEREITALVRARYTVAGAEVMPREDAQP
jgi:hypothetical protein